MRHRLVLTAFMAALVVAPMLHGQQQNAPHVGYVYPAGGQQGTTVRVRVGGQFLDGVTGVFVSGSGVRAKFVSLDKPLNQQQINDLRDKLQELQKNMADPAIRKELLEQRAKLADSLRRNAAPVLSEMVTIEVTLAADAEPGARALRLATPLGLSTPLVFQVGQLPEFSERDLNNPVTEPAMAITLPATVNGRIIPGDAARLQLAPRAAGQYLPGDVDRYRFQARKGQQLVLAASARDLMPYLADAVPGWFQATLALFDAEGHELAYDDDFRFHPDPVIHYQVPGDGEYIVEIKDALYRGREDFVYRIAIGELPFVTSIFPLGGPAGAKTTVEVTGWNLPSSRVTMNAEERPGTYSLRARNGALMSNAMPFAVDALPDRVEHEPNDSTKDAQPIVLPAIVNGRIQQPGDWDVFSFRGRAGDQVVAEVQARRLDSPLDSTLELTDASGTRIAFNDDHTDKGAGLITHQADSLIAVTLPAAGLYYVRLGDAQHKGGPEYAYRLRVSAPQPDFDLRIAPSAINVSGGTSVPVTVYALRRDGFSGDIAIELKDAPAGFTLGGGVLPAGQDDVRMTVSAPPVAPNATNEPNSMKLVGRAMVQGRQVERIATPVDEMMQAFAYRHLVPADDLRVSVSGRGGIRVPVRILTALPIRIPMGGAVHVPITLPPAYLAFEKIEFELSAPPEGITLHDGSVSKTGGEFLLSADAAKVKPGLRGNLIVTISGERVPPANAPTAVRRRVVMGTLPAIAFEVR